MNEKLGEITALKSLLADTDYQIIKSAEELLSSKSIADLLGRLAGLGEDIRETIQRRAAWRARINELETEIEILEIELPTEQNLDERIDQNGE